jgi:hypothetical protein
VAVNVTIAMDAVSAKVEFTFTGKKFLMGVETLPAGATSPSAVGRLPTPPSPANELQKCDDFGLNSGLTAMPGDKGLEHSLEGGHLRSIACQNSKL